MEDSYERENEQNPEPLISLTIHADLSTPLTYVFDSLE